MSQRRNANPTGRARATERTPEEASDLLDMKALAASARAGATPSPRLLNPAELSGVVARRDSVVGMRVLDPAAARGGLPGWIWGAAGCLSVVAVGLAAFSVLNLSSLVSTSDSTLPLVAAGVIPPSPTIVTMPVPAQATTAAQATPPTVPVAEAPGKAVAVKLAKRAPKKATEVDAMLSAVLADRGSTPTGRAVPSQAGKKATDETPPPAAASGESAAPPRNPLDDVNAALDDLQPKLKQCFRRFQIPGIANVKLVVDPSGSIEPASLSGDFEGTPTGDCVMQELSSATLPPFKGSPVQLNHAFVLR